MTKTIHEIVQASPNGDGRPRNPIQYLETVVAYGLRRKTGTSSGEWKPSNYAIYARIYTKRSQFQSQQLRLVDLGCGTGRSTLHLLRLAPQDAEVIGVDAAPGMWEVANAVIQKETPRKQEGISG
ncbi:hypothetical protein CNMCM5623_004718 [Aspergillus felis]|uniref:Methyltransferase domain-containing protein n=1 Tax=Aspergillus felis TaxID=1287682 RepID=A0A8H6QH10_9EURO|nr:hypothetical protein CNMCM5623_004718 [Aspergillus felis]KAF7179980.1 hypothetical protein CNMCM7691_009032 [Aspergillus felis]